MFEFQERKVEIDDFGNKTVEFAVDLMYKRRIYPYNPQTFIGIIQIC